MLWLLNLRSLLLSLWLLNFLLRLLSWLLNLRFLLLVSAVAELSPEVVVLVVEPVLVVDLEVSEPGVVFVAVVSVADVAEPQVSVDIAVVFVVLVPVSVVVVEVDSSGRPKFLAFPNVDHYRQLFQFC